MFKFTIPGECVGKGRPRFTSVGGFTKSYTPAKTSNYENWVKACFCEKYPSGSFSLNSETPLRVVFVAYFAVPSSVSNKKRADMLAGKIRPTKKPDIDNIEKGILDALNGVAYHDDKQVVEVSKKKFYSENPRVVVLIKEI